MSITREVFDKDKFSMRAAAHNSKEHPILKFLLEKSKRAYTVKEIEKGVKLTEAGVRHMLRKLIKKKLVEHKSPYFMAILNSKKKKKKK